ncbi:MAG: hypothetical protein RL071_2187 [Pseudomonadota bacterium]|jgi:hypothetical protein
MMVQDLAEVYAPLAEVKADGRPTPRYADPMRWTILALAACSGAPAPESPATPAGLPAVAPGGDPAPAGGAAADGAPGPAEGPREVLAAVRLEVLGASTDWSNGDREAASARVLRAYVARFEPVEGALRAVDPRATLELEYSFGRLAARLARPGEPLAVAKHVQALTGQLDGLAARLPVDPSRPPPPPVAPPAAIDTPLPAHLRAGDVKAPKEKPESP